MSAYQPETAPETAQLTADVVLLGTGDDGQQYVLLIRRGGDPYVGQWALPGGYVNAGEETGAAARRELLEETGLHVHGLDLVGVYAAPGRDPRGRFVTFAYTTTLTGPLPEPTAGDDATEARWWPIWALAMGDPEMAFDHYEIVAAALRTEVRRCETAPTSSSTCRRNLSMTVAPERAPSSEPSARTDLAAAVDASTCLDEAFHALAELASWEAEHGPHVLGGVGADLAALRELAVPAADHVHVHGLLPTRTDVPATAAPAPGPASREEV